MTFEEIAKSAMTLTEAESEKVAKKIVKEYAIALKAMNEEIKTVYANLTGSKPEDYFNYMTKYNRLALMIEDTQKKYLAVSKIVGKETEAAAESAIANSYYRNLYAGNFGAPAQGIFVALDQKVIDVSVYGTPEAWKTISDTATFGRSETYMPQSGTLIDQLVTKRNAQVIQDIESAIRSGLMAGESYSKMAARVKKIMDTDAWKALRIVNTETHRNQMAGQYASMMAMRSEGLEAKRMIVSTLDTRTRPQSGFVDGKVEDDDGYFHYPGDVLVAIPGNSGRPEWDIQDRESAIMTVDGMPPEVRRGRDPVTGQTDIISWSSFDDWMKANNLSYDKNGKMVQSGSSAVKAVKPIQAKKAFTPSKTVKEAEQWAKDNLDVRFAGYGKADINMVNEWNKGAYENILRFPELKNNLRDIGTNQELRKNYIKRRTDAYWQSSEVVRLRNMGYNDTRIGEIFDEWSTRKAGKTKGTTLATSYGVPSEKDYRYGVGINNKYTTDYKKTLEILQRDVTSGFHPEGCNTMKGIIDHEMGHQIDNLLGRVSKTSAFDELLKGIDIKDSLSQYPVTYRDNASIKAETLAEAWSEFNNNPSPRPLAKAIGDFILKEYAKQFGGK